MFGIDGLGPDLGDTELHETQDCQDTGLDIGPDADDSTGELLGTDLLERLGVGAVCRDDVGEVARIALHDLGILVDREHFMPQPDE